MSSSTPFYICDYCDTEFKRSNHEDEHGWDEKIFCSAKCLKHHVASLCSDCQTIPCTCGDYDLAEDTSCCGDNDDYCDDDGYDSE